MDWNGFILILSLRVWRIWYGHIGLQHKLQLLNDKSMTPLINAINNGSCECFGDILTSDDYNVAAMLIPKFKLNYLQPSQCATMKDMLIWAVQATIGEQEPPPPLSSSCDPADDSLFSFMSQTAADNTASTILTAEVDTYLASNSTDTASLAAFPHTAAAFRKYNAAPPSSAAVERLFSIVRDKFWRPDSAKCQTLCSNKQCF